MFRALTEPLPLPQAPARPPAAQALGPVVVALSEDLALLEALGGAISARERFTAAPTLERFSDLLLASSADIALIDCERLEGAPATFFSRLHRQFPRLTLLAAGDGASQQLLAPLLADGTILRFAHRPVSAQRLRLFLESATRHRDGTDAAANAEPAAAAEATATRAGPARGAAIRTWVLIGALGALLAGAVAWWWPPSAPPLSANALADSAPAGPRRSDTAAAADTAASATAPAPAPLPAPAPAPADEVQRWVELASARMQAGALIAPANDNARSYIEQAAARAPENAAVRAAAHELGERLISATRSALGAGDLRAAQRWLEASRAYHVGAATLAELQSELEQARAAPAPTPTLAPAAPGGDTP